MSHLPARIWRATCKLVKTVLPDKECRDCGAPPGSKLKCLMGFNDIHAWERDANDVERVSIALSMQQGRDNAPHDEHNPWDFYEYLSDEEQEEWRVSARVAIAAYNEKKEPHWMTARKNKECWCVGRLRDLHFKGWCPIHG